VQPSITEFHPTPYSPPGSTYPPDLDDPIVLPKCPIRFYGFLSGFFYSTPRKILDIFPNTFPNAKCNSHLSSLHRRLVVFLLMGLAKATNSARAGLGHNAACYSPPTIQSFCVPVFSFSFSFNSVHISLLRHFCPTKFFSPHLIFPCGGHCFPPSLCVVEFPHRDLVPRWATGPPTCRSSFFGFGLFRFSIFGSPTLFPPFSILVFRKAVSLFTPLTL